MMTYTWGPRVTPTGTRFRLWAPACDDVVLELDDGRTMTMTPAREGWHEARTEASPGTKYRFRIDDIAFGDPASRAQCGDVHGWSVVTGAVRTARTSHWKGRPWDEAVIYEMHVGLAGGFQGCTARMPSLAQLGITAIELMPIADFPGARNWGYDGVFPFAPDESYGTREDLAQLIDTAHASGIMVLLDVVYNHFGPDGNYLSHYAPQFFRTDRKTPWGNAIDFRQKPVRSFFIENALYWIHEFGVDGLRLDAVHAIQDRSFLDELAAAVRASVRGERHVHLIVENENNDASLLDEYDAQWNDDVHHALHVLLTGEADSYYEDFAIAPATHLAHALAHGFAYEGQHSAHRGAARGTRSDSLSTTHFIACLQNHDQIGNRALGERLISLADVRALKAAVALLMLCPQIPLVFMGEEVGATQPFLYFTDHRDSQLADAVREGRRNEFATFPAFANPDSRAHIPDPNAATTFDASRPAPGADASKWTAFYKKLIAARCAFVMPRLANSHGESAAALGDKTVVAHWTMGDGSRLTIATNLGPSPVSASWPVVDAFWGDTNESLLGPFSTVAWLEKQS